MYSEDEYLMLSGLQHFVFCRRQWALIHIEQQWEENYRTADGQVMHRNVHDADFREKRGDTIIARAMAVSSSRLGISGECDVVEFRKSKDGIELFGIDGKYDVIPIEYKRGSPKENSSDIMQLAAQAMCLEEMHELYRKQYTPKVKHAKACMLFKRYCLSPHGESGLK